MLSEPRRKKQRITDDPNNLRWANDNEKIGQKLLEKMGWRAGSGLGVREQGRTNSLAVKANAGLRGLGCDSKTDLDVHSEHRRNFDSLLTSLRQTTSDVSNSVQGPESDSTPQHPCSLTSLSKSSRRRIHYSRFARGKELSTASAIDLATVTGDLEKRSVASALDPTVDKQPSFQLRREEKSDSDREKYFEEASTKTIIRQRFVKSSAR